MATDQPTFVELEESARAAVNCLKLFPEFGGAKIAIIGGAALWKHIPAGRTTMVAIIFKFPALTIVPGR